jgi:hypothetical protein
MIQVIKCNTGRNGAHAVYLYSVIPFHKKEILVHTNLSVMNVGELRCHLSGAFFEVLNGSGIRTSTS